MNVKQATLYPFSIIAKHQLVVQKRSLKKKIVYDIHSFELSILKPTIE